MKLYFFPGACSLASHIVALEADVPLDIAPVTFSETGKSVAGRDFLEINPKGVVPTIEMDDGMRLTENAVVMQYLAGLKPEAGLLPAEGMERWRCLELVNYIATELHKSFAPLFNPTFHDVPKEPFITTIRQRFAQLSQMLGDKAFLLGDRFTIADAYLFTILGWTRAVPDVDWELAPNLLSFIERVGARPAVIRAMQAEGLLGAQ